MSAATKNQFAYHLGRKVGRYTLLELLGRGGTAEVYRSVHPELKRDVAIKVLFPSHTLDEGFVRRFRHEAQTAAALIHPHIVQIYDFEVTTDGLYIIVMQYVAGPSLADYLNGRDAPLSLAKGYAIFQQIADALQFAHDAGTIHRDLKPANVLLNGRDQVYLTDFGFAKMLGVDMQTRSSVTLGTPVFMAPEQIEGSPVSAATDVYALGAILYKMLTNQLPYNEDNVLAMILRKIEELPPSPRTLNPAIPASVEKLIYKAMAIQPDKRFPTVQAMSAAFAQAVDMDDAAAPWLMGANSVNGRLGKTAQAKRFSKKWAAVLSGAVVLFLLGFFFLGNDGNGRFVPIGPSETAVTSEMSEATPVPALPPAPSKTSTPTTAPTSTTSPTKKPTPTRTPTWTPTTSRTPSATPSASPTPTATPPNTATPTFVPTSTFTPLPTVTAVPPTPIPPTQRPSQPTAPPAPTQPPAPPTRTPPAQPTQTPSP